MSKVIICLSDCGKSICMNDVFLSSGKQSDPGHFFSMSPFVIILRLKKVSWITLLSTTYMHVSECLLLLNFLKVF